MADLNLTPQEQNLVDYHRNNIKFNNVGRSNSGDPVTVYSTGVDIDSGPYKGKIATVPGYVNGKIIDPDTAKEYWNKEINQGKWPIYDSSEQENKRAEEIHSIMENESEDAMNAGKAEGYKKGGKVQNKNRKEKLVKRYKGQKTSQTKIFNGTVVRGHGIEQRGKTKGRFV